MKTILDEITGYTIILGASEDVGIYLAPSKIASSMNFEAQDFYRLIIHESNLTALESKMAALQRVKTNLDFDYNDYDNRGYITVTDASGFSVDDDITGVTSGATGTIYKIDGSILYLKDNDESAGTWQIGEVVGGTTVASTFTTTLFPFWLFNTVIDKQYTIQSYVDAHGEWWAWIRFEARWAL